MSIGIERYVSKFFMILFSAFGNAELSLYNVNCKSARQDPYTQMPPLGGIDGPVTAATRAGSIGSKSPHSKLNPNLTSTYLIQRLRIAQHK